MKFHSALDSIEKENRILRIGLIALLLLAILLCVTVMGTASQTPLMIERGCFSRRVTPASDIATEDELKAFAAVALKERFDTKGEGLELLSIKQRGYRQVEQAELEKQTMKQVLIVNGVVVAHDGLTVDADRLISVGEIRSTFRFPLKLKLETTTRSEENPYGLILSEVDELKSEVKK